jgi:modulator of FtsH protease
LGFGLGAILSVYLALPHGPQVVGTAFGGTAVIFLGLSGYALTSKRDFSFMGGFLFAGMMVLVIAMLANIFLAMPALSLAISSGIILVMSGFILFDTSRIKSGAETNYIMATYGIYLSIFNLFISLLQILGIMSDD